jgi:hypothetical protein
VPLIVAGGVPVGAGCRIGAADFDGRGLG